MNKIKNNLDIVFLLDKSGSMSGMENDTIGGYNSYLKDNKYNNSCITTILFNNNIEYLCENIPIEKANKLSKRNYFTSGSTALYDAIGSSINYLDKKKSCNALIVITTDGYENSSREFNKEKIKKMIKSHDNYKFIYIGADIDSYSEGMDIGLNKDSIANYEKNSRGVSRLFKSISKASTMCMNESFDESWKDELN